MSLGLKIGVALSGLTFAAWLVTNSDTIWKILIAGMLFILLAELNSLSSGKEKS